jgi:N-acetylneuraminic acid mutarotase
VNKSVYTFGGYDGSKRLDTIDKYNIKKDQWDECPFKLRFALSNCACFSPFLNKVVIFGGGFSSGFSHFVEMIDIKSGEWKSIPKMKEGRDLRNKVVYCDGHAYAIGGLNCKCEKIGISRKRWTPIDDYVINDNLDSWSCALMFTPSSSFSDQDMEVIEDPDENIIVDESEEEQNDTEIELIVGEHHEEPLAEEMYDSLSESS